MLDALDEETAYTDDGWELVRLAYEEEAIEEGTELMTLEATEDGTELITLDATDDITDDAMDDAHNIARILGLVLHRARTGGRE